LRSYSIYGSYQVALKKLKSELKKSNIEYSFWGNLETAMTSLVSLAGIISLLSLSIYLYATGKIVFGELITSWIFDNKI
ncbi:ABC transporter ATP-binding protein, partial [Lactobacillus gasseri]